LRLTILDLMGIVAVVAVVCGVATGAVPCSAAAILLFVGALSALFAIETAEDHAP
jgi:hypothetical protein